MLTVACVLRSGGDYDSQYVEALQNAVRRHLTLPYEFVCLSDIDLACCATIPLEHNWPKWWPKIELFNLKGPVLFADLDTIILGNIDEWAQAILEQGDSEIIMIRPFNPAYVGTSFGSGLMGWNCDLSFVYDRFIYPRDRRYRLEQTYVRKALLRNEIKITPIQDVIDGVYSYKRHCTEGLPEDARIVCFHGKPRPLQSTDISWVKENWK